jgi:hypothetical protein
MNLTQQQRVVLRAALFAETAPTLVAARTAGDAQAMADFYNTNSTFIVWRSSVPVTEMQASYVWSEIVALTPGQFNALSLMQAQGALTPSVPNVRTGMGTILASATATLAALTALAKRAATFGEKVFATGTGTSGSPGLLVAEGSITAQDIAQAWWGS